MQDAAQVTRAPVGESFPALALDISYVGGWLAIALVVAAILRRSLARLARRSPSAFTEVLAASLPRPAAIALFLLSLSAGVAWLPLPDGVSAPMRKVFPVLFGMLAIASLMRVSFRSIDAYGRSNPSLRSSAGIGRAAVWLIGLAALALFICDMLGISLAPALTALGVGSLAFALALQETLANFFAGIYLLADKPVTPGDFIRLDGGHEGYVDSIGWRSTQLRTVSSNIVIVPNAALSKAIITNFSRPSPKASIELRIDVADDEDVDRVEDLLVDEAKRAADVDGVMSDPAPLVRFNPGFVDGALAFTVTCQIVDYTAQGRVQHELRKRIVRRLRKENVSLPKGLEVTRVRAAPPT